MTGFLSRHGQRKLVERLTPTCMAACELSYPKSFANVGVREWVVTVRVKEDPGRTLEAGAQAGSEEGVRESGTPFHVGECA